MSSVFSLTGQIRAGRIRGEANALPDVGPDCDRLMEVGGPERHRFVEETPAPVA